VRIEQQVEIPAPIERVWAFLDDIPRVATCMPGATLTAELDERTYEGLVAVKIGPIAVNYQGTVVIERKDPEDHSVLMNASGKDRKGAGSAKALIEARLIAIDAGTTAISVSSDLKLTGRVAALGRGVRDVVAKVFAEFAQRISAELEADERGDGPGAGAAAGAAPNAPIKAGALVRSVIKDRISRRPARQQGAGD
jgi:carbon monoxide dehydrogenase subunit G